MFGERSGSKTSKNSFFRIDGKSLDGILETKGGAMTLKLTWKDCVKQPPTEQNGN